MSSPKYGRRKVRVDPRISVPPNIIDVEIDRDSPLITGTSTSAGGGSNNGYTGGVSRDDRPTQIKPTDPAPVLTGTNPWGVAKLIGQTLVINSDGALVVEVEWELPDSEYGYEWRVNRV